MQQIIDGANRTNAYDLAIVSPLTHAPALSARLDNAIYLKREDEQKTHSFKVRGAYQKISRLSAREKSCGVITSSAGNHAQGVALVAQKLGIRATIVMPTSTAKIKSSAVVRMNAKVILHGDTFDDAYQHAKKLSKSEGMIFVHPYDDIEVISGQATIGKELLEQLDPIDKIFVPVGGGGLIGGIGTYVKHYSPKTKIIAVEPHESPTLFASIQAGHPVNLSDVGRFVDGVAIRQVGVQSFKVAQQVVDEIVLVSNDEICAAVKDIYEDVRSIAELSGALATAGAKKYIEDNDTRGENIVTIVSGANVNFDRLRYIAERAELGEHNEAVFAAKIPEQPGSFLRFCKALGNHVITEFNYRFEKNDEAHVFVGVGVSGIDEKTALLGELSKNYEVIDMSENSIAKTHVRYMVGGRALVENEVVYHCRFPEKPGALLQFLTKIGSEWNISLFHYRNHGADFGRVLVGLQVPGAEIEKLERRLGELNFDFQNETENQAYRYFL